MKRTLLTVSAVLALQPFFSADARADHYAELTSTEPTILLRCHKTLSTENNTFEEEQIESHLSYSEAFTEQHRSRNSPIREILRNRQNHHSASVPIVIEIQGECDAIRVGLGSDLSQDELFPGELNHSNDYEALYEMLRDRHDNPPNAPRPWLIRPGSGWDWLFRQSNADIYNDAATSDPTPCACIKAPCHCPAFSFPSYLASFAYLPNRVPT